MVGTPHKVTTRKSVTRKLPVELLRNEWHSQFIGVLIPMLLPVAEQIMREAPSRIELEQLRDGGHSQMAAIMPPWLFPMP